MQLQKSIRSVADCTNLRLESMLPPGRLIETVTVESDRGGRSGAATRPSAAATSHILAMGLNYIPASTFPTTSAAIEVAS